MNQNTCPPCTGNCNQGRTCPARTEADPETRAPHGSGIALAVIVRLGVIGLALGIVLGGAPFVFGTVFGCAVCCLAWCFALQMVSA